MPKPAVAVPAKKPPAKKKPAPPAAAVDHAAMGRATSTEASPIDHDAVGHASAPAAGEPRQPIPELTALDRDAAFPEVHAHAAHDRANHSFVLLDQLETWNGDDGSAVGWEALGWVGGDISRLWLRSEGEALDGSVEHANVEVLYGQAISPWWDLVAGLRHDFGDGPSQTFAALGLMGLSPYKFEINATAYLGQSAQTALRFEGEYDTLLTNRLILQWQAGIELFGKDDPGRGVGSGLSTTEAGLRLRYEVTRKFAPYIGLAWERAHGQTAELRRGASHDVTDTRIVAGVRLWF